MATSSDGKLPLLFLLLCFGLTIGYRLDRPRVLLPYSPSTSIRAELHVSDPEGGCFEWRSSRFQDIEVVPLGSSNKECSDRAEIRTTSKVAGNVSAMVYAFDRASQTRLSCEVRVDYISSIEILSTTNVIFVDAVPVMMHIQARNNRGSAFSTLGALPFEWSLEKKDNGNHERVVRIVPFTESEWEGRPEIVDLESNGKKGHSVLVEGISNGWTQLTAKLSHSFFNNVPSHTLDVIVIANLQLVPSYTLYVPLHSIIPFQVEIIRQQKTHKVSMPSSQYHLKVDDPSICSLDIQSSSVTAIKKGTTDIQLVNYNVDSKLDGISPPSTTIHVTDPDKVGFSITGDNWVVEVGRRYSIQINLLDIHDNLMYIADGTKFETVISKEELTVDYASQNGSYFEVSGRKSGKVMISSTFISIGSKNNNEIIEIKDGVRGEQEMDVVDPIIITPSIIILPFLNNGKKSQWTMKASGGSGALEWSVDNDSIVSIHSSNGLIQSKIVGETRIKAVDKRNRAHYDHAMVGVVDVIDISIGKSRLEAVEGSILWLNIQLDGLTTNGEKVSITDCTMVDVSIVVDDEGIIKHDSKKDNMIPNEGTGCVTIPFNAIHSGNTKITVELSSSQISVSQHISVYPPLSTSFHSDRLNLAIGSIYRIDLKGGPRPWILDTSAAFHKGRTAKGSASTSIDDDIVNVKCSNEGGISDIELMVGNDITPSNQIPAIERINIRLCCITPDRIVIKSKRSNRNIDIDDDIGRRNELSLCPANTRSLFVSSSLNLILIGYGKCNKEDEERQLDSISSLSVKWSTYNDELVKVEGLNDEAIVHPQGKIGSVRVNAQCSSNLKANIDLKLFDKAVANPSSLILWNDKSMKGDIRIIGGSGHFIVKTISSNDHFKYTHDKDIIKITPYSIGSSVLSIHDACIDDSHIEIPIKITDIHHIRIDAPDYMEVGSRIKVNLKAVDDNGEEFSDDIVQLMDIILNSTGSLVSIEKISGNRYSLIALHIGFVSLSATGRSSGMPSTKLTSSPHSIQIFSPVLLFPKVVTLLSESTFQLEVVGGPKPTPSISFSLNDTRIAFVHSNGLIHSSTHIGSSSIIGSIRFGPNLISKDSVVVNVVQLKGVRIIVSSLEVEKGNKILARVEGIDDTHTPFSFGGAIHPLKITWSLNNTDIFKVYSPFGNSIREMESNQYSIWLDSIESGIATLSVTVQYHPLSSIHFANKETTYKDQVELGSISPLTFTNPSIETGVILLYPRSSIQLSTNWPSSRTKFNIGKEDSNLISVTPCGILSSIGVEGIGSIQMIREGRVIISSVQVVQPSSIDVHISPQFESTTDSYLSHIPLGSQLNINIILRDNIGRLIHGNGEGKILFRPHRFDLTTIEGRNNNRTLSVRLIKEGETVLKIWDPIVPSLNTFVRLNCKDVMSPSSTVIVSSDIICLHSPIEENEQEWKSDDNKVIQSIDSSNGVFKALSPGMSHVHLSTPHSHHSFYTTITVHSPSVIRFSSRSSKWVTNVEGSTFYFPLLIGTNESINEIEDRKKLSAIDCSSQSISPITPLFDCSISFSNSQLGSASSIFRTTSYFDSNQGQYGCRVESQSKSTPPFVYEASKSELEVRASWTIDGKVIESSISSLFHVAFSVLNEEIILNNYDRFISILTIHVSCDQSSDIRVVSSSDYIHMKELSSRPSQDKTLFNDNSLKWIELTLNENGDRIEDSYEVIVESITSGQQIKVPVKIHFIGETVKKAYRELESNGFLDFCYVFISRFSYLIPSLIGACIVCIITMLVWRYIHNSGVKYGIASRHNASAFLSDSRNDSGMSPISPSLDWSNPFTPQYQSTPRDALRRISPHNKIFSNGDSNDVMRRKAGRYD